MQIQTEAKWMLKTWRRVAVVMLLTSLIGACSSSPPTTEYLLDSPELSVLENADRVEALIVVGGVEVAPFLAGSGIVQVRDGMTLHQANYHRWAEALPSQLQRQLRLGLQQQLPGVTWLPIQGSAHLRSLDYRLDMSIDNFHLLANGEATVSGQWQLRSAGQGFVDAGQFHVSRSLQGDGYAELVNALQLAWSESLQEIALSLAVTLEILALERND